MTLTMYDSHGRAIQVARADSVNEFRSYDTRGLLGRAWQSVGSEESGTQILFTAYQYDALGRRTHVISPASSSALSTANAALAVQQGAGMVVQDLEYNAFGEVISKGTNGYAEREKYAYDNAGRLVHSYASRGQDSDAGGIWQFQIYDLLGRQRAQAASAKRRAPTQHHRRVAADRSRQGLDPDRHPDRARARPGHGQTQDRPRHRPGHHPRRTRVRLEALQGTAQPDHHRGRHAQHPNAMVCLRQHEPPDPGGRGSQRQRARPGQPHGRPGPHPHVRPERQA
ncbi:hypothetical protein IB243_04020 [Acidovorax sp. ACV01]|nr:hypothetical protein [Acidovorax sp. ACV01]